MPVHNHRGKPWTKLERFITCKAHRQLHRQRHIDLQEFRRARQTMRHRCLSCSLQSPSREEIRYAPALLALASSQIGQQHIVLLCSLHKTFAS